MAKDRPELRVTKMACGFCLDGNHERCSIAIASSIPHAQNPNGIIWLCGCEVGICDSVRLKCTTCGNRNTPEVDDRTYRCKDAEACAMSIESRRKENPNHQIMDEIYRRAEMAKVANDEAKAKTAKATKTPKTGTCVCGCKGTTKGGLFLPGHDARFVSQTVAGVEEKGFTKAATDAGRKTLKDAGASDTLVAKYDKSVGLAKDRADKKAAAKAEKDAAKASK